MTTITKLKPQLESGRISQMIAGEVRAELGRQAINQTELARRMGVSQVWVSRRVGRNPDVDLRVEDIQQIAEALDVAVERLLIAWLPRLDSNQQPSVYPYPQVSVVDLEAYRVTGRVTPYPRPLEDDEERAS